MASSERVSTFHSDDPDSHMRKAMMGEAIGKGINTLAQGITGGIQFYEQQQARDLNTIVTSGGLVGGLDKLPDETLDKLPGVTGFEWPRNQDKDSPHYGHVMVTPTAEQTLMRIRADYATRNPDEYARHALDIMKPDTPPIEEGLKHEEIKMHADNAALVAKTATDNRAMQVTEKEKDRNAAYDRVIQTDTDALQRSNLTHQQKDAYLDRPHTGLVVDRNSGKLISRSAAEMSLSEGESFEDRFDTVSRRDVKDMQSHETQSNNMRHQRLMEHDARNKTRLLRQQVKLAINSKTSTEFNHLMDAWLRAKKSGDEDAIAKTDFNLKNFTKKNLSYMQPEVIEQNWYDISGWFTGIYEGQTAHPLAVEQNASEPAPLSFGGFGNESGAPMSSVTSTTHRRPTTTSTTSTTLPPRVQDLRGARVQGGGGGGSAATAPRSDKPTPYTHAAEDAANLDLELPEE